MGVTVAQRGLNRQIHTLAIAQHLIVPEADHSITLAFDDRRTRSIRFGCVLTTVNLDHQLGRVTSEIDDEMANGHLMAEPPFRKGVP